MVHIFLNFSGQRPGMPPVSVPVSMAPGGILPPRMNQPPPGMPPRPDNRLPPPGMRPGMPPGKPCYL